MSPYDQLDPAIQAEMRERFRAAPLHALLDLEIRPFDPDGDGLVTVDMPITPNAYGWDGNLHGGAIATLVDVACAAAASRASDFDPFRNALVTSDMHVRYLGRPRGAQLRGEAKVVKSGRTLIVVEGRGVDEAGTVVAVADFSAMLIPLRTPLAPEA